jgi:hypothetical protein
MHLKNNKHEDEMMLKEKIKSILYEKIDEF